MPTQSVQQLTYVFELTSLGNNHCRFDPVCWQRMTVAVSDYCWNLSG